ncbi:unnamed protein product, partial [Onchocerca ochengi]
ILAKPVYKSVMRAGNYFVSSMAFNQMVKWLLNRIRLEYVVHHLLRPSSLKPPVDAMCHLLSFIHSSNDLNKETIINKIKCNEERLILSADIIDVVRIGKYKHLFHLEQMVTGCEDPASSYVRGHRSIGRDIIDIVLSFILGPNSQTATDQIIIKDGASLIDDTPSRIPDTQTAPWVDRNGI